MQSTDGERLSSHRERERERRSWPLSHCALSPICMVALHSGPRERLGAPSGFAPSRVGEYGAAGCSRSPTEEEEEAESGAEN